MNTSGKTKNQSNESDNFVQFDERHIQVIRQEGEKTRKTIVLVAVVSVVVLIASPVLLAYSPILVLIVGVGLFSALIGAFIGRSISRKREQSILNEVANRNEDRIIPLQDKNSG